MKCKFCGRLNQNNPSDHYHRHECWSKDVLKRIETATPEQLPKLQRELEQARNTGD